MSKQRINAKVYYGKRGDGFKFEVEEIRRIDWYSTYEEFIKSVVSAYKAGRINSHDDYKVHYLFYYDLDGELVRICTQHELDIAIADFSSCNKVKSSQDKPVVKFHIEMQKSADLQD